MAHKDREEKMVCISMAKSINNSDTREAFGGKERDG